MSDVPGYAGAFPASGSLLHTRLPRYLLRDRDQIYGDPFRTQAASMAITEVLTAPRSPWQSLYVERLIGSIRRECLDHVLVVNEGSLRRQIASYLEYHHGCRGHLSLGKDAPDGREVEPPELGRIVAIPKVRGPAPPLRTKSCLKSNLRSGARSMPAPALAKDYLAWLGDT